MKVILLVTSACVLSFLLSFGHLHISEARSEPNAPIALPAPPSGKQAKFARCSPQPTPLSEEERNDPQREMTADQVLDGLLGSDDVDGDGICNSADNCIFTPN